MGSTDERTPGDRRSGIKIVISVAVISVALGGLLYASTREGAEYYKFVDEVVAGPEGLRSRRLQVHGYVVDGSIEKARDRLEYRFRIESLPPRAPATMTVHYRGIVPDTFKSGSEVVAIGRLASADLGLLEADGIKAKCPSKYEAKPTFGAPGTALSAAPAAAAPGYGTPAVAAPAPPTAGLPAAGLPAAGLPAAIAPSAATAPPPR